MTQRDGMILHTRVGHTACGKQAYSSRRAARFARKTSPHLANRDGLAAYRCPLCDFFHLGHPGPRVTSGEMSRAERFS